MIGYAFAPQTLRHDPPPTMLRTAGAAVALGEDNIAGPARCAAAHELVEASGLLDRLARLDVAPAPDAALRAVHDAAYLAALEAASAGGPWAFDFAPVTFATADAARLSAGCGLAAVDAVLDGRVRRAFAQTHPPGHHAERALAAGSSYLNTVACAAAHARARGAERVLIVDWDVHVGNGAEQIFAHDPTVLALSIHQEGWYPDHAGDVASSGADSTTVNVPLPPAVGDDGYLLVLEAVVAPIARRFAPDAIVVAAGQDIGIFDPMGRMLVSAAGFRALGARIAALADEVCEGRLIVCVEGGYSLLYAPLCALRVLEGIAGEDARVADPFEGDAELRAAATPPDGRLDAAIERVRTTHSRWFREERSHR